jgi:prepilin-type N-terminal cleavage/methylation domain-containing protein
MPEDSSPCGTRNGAGGEPRHLMRAFTLIELLVVVAIIALLVAILLPSLGKARSLARTTLCATRIAQLTKAMLLYTDDFSETPPFMARCPDVDFPRPESMMYDPRENWVVNLPANLWDLSESLDAQRKTSFFRCEQAKWPDNVRVPDSGTLFQYARFPNLYRCPDFERVTHPEKIQNAFNYTRGEWGRKFRVPPSWSAAGYANEDGWDPLGDYAGPILKVSAVFSPGALPILVDEQWDRHVARPPALFGQVGESQWHYMDVDTLLCSHDEVGRYHPPMVRESEYYPPKLLIERGGIGYYDGHADFRRDPYPSPNPSGRGLIPGEETGYIGYMRASLKFAFEALYAQRGMKAPIDIPSVDIP